MTFNARAPVLDVCKSQVTVMISLLLCKRWLEWSKKRRLPEKQTTRSSHRFFTRSALEITARFSFYLQVASPTEVQAGALAQGASCT